MRSTVRSHLGFTLVELMIVVVVVAILASIALPSYQEYIRRSRRAEAQALLNDAAARQERYRAQNGRYTDDVLKLRLPWGDKSENGYYLLTATVSGLSYTLMAAPQKAQVNDKCGDFILSSAGEKSNSAGTTEDCWR